MTSGKTARVVSRERGGNWRYTWSCEQCVYNHHRRWRSELDAVMDAAYHNGVEHGDGSLDLARGLLDPLRITGAACATHGVQRQRLAGTLLLSLPFDATRRDIDRGKGLFCPVPGCTNVMAPTLQVL